MAARGNAIAERRLRYMPPKRAIAVRGAKFGAGGRNRSAAPKIIRRSPIQLLIAYILDEPLHHISAASLQLISTNGRTLTIDIKFPELIFLWFNPPTSSHKNSQNKSLLPQRFLRPEKVPKLNCLFAWVTDIVRENHGLV